MSGAGRHCVRTLWQRVVAAVPRLGFCVGFGFLHRVYASTNDYQWQRGPPGWATLLFIDVLMMKVRT